MSEILCLPPFGPPPFQAPTPLALTPSGPLFSISHFFWVGSLLPLWAAVRVGWSWVFSGVLGRFGGTGRS